MAGGLRGYHHKLMDSHTPDRLMMPTPPNLPGKGDLGFLFNWLVLVRLA